MKRYLLNIIAITLCLCALLTFVACGKVENKAPTEDDTKQPSDDIMDEPTVAVDPQSRNKILEGIIELNKNGATIIYTSHYMEEVEQLFQQLIEWHQAQSVGLFHKFGWKIGFQFVKQQAVQVEALFQYFVLIGCCQLCLGYPVVGVVQVAECIQHHADGQ